MWRRSALLRHLTLSARNALVDKPHQFRSVTHCTTGGGGGGDDDVTMQRLRRHLLELRQRQRRMRGIASSSSSASSADPCVFKSDVLSRTRVVTSESECREVSDRLLRERRPIAVDMEGVQLDRLGMVQVRTAGGQIYLFRTGRNPALLGPEGGLGEVLADGGITKVMHGASGDCIAIYKEGVKMWGLYDTAIAHRVISYQSRGGMLTSESISFNDMCDAYGVHVNPIKEHLHGTLWKRQNAFLDLENLPEDLVFYSAADVEPLLDLYEITSSLIDEDFWPLFREMCELELTRAIDLDDTQAKKKIRLRLQACDVFLSNLASTVRKVDIYELAAQQESPKRVLFSYSDRSAHVLLPTRASAVVLYRCLSEKGGLPEGQFGPEAKVSLVQELKGDEIYESALKYERHLDRLKEDNYVVDQELSTSLVDRIIRAKCPIVVDFHLHPHHTSLEVFPCRYPALKFNVSYESVTKGGLGELISSPEVVKVAARIDIANVYSALRSCSAANFRPRNFFDVSTAFRLLDLWQYGQSLYQTTSPSLKEVMRKFGLPSDCRLENLLFIYLHLREMLPSELLEFLDAKAQIDVDVGAQICYAEAKEARKQLRTKFETNSLHVQLERGKASDLKPALTRFLKESDMQFQRIVADGKQAVVEMRYHSDIYLVVKRLQSANLDPGVVVMASNIEPKIITEKRPLKPIDTTRLTKVTRSHDDALRELGFHKLLKEMAATRAAELCKEDEQGKGRSLSERSETVEAKAMGRKKLSSLNADELKSIFR